MTSYRSLNHTKWACQYHVVFIPKYRKKAIYADLRRYLGDVLRRLAQRRESEVEEGHLMVDHVHLMLSIPPKYSVADGSARLSGLAEASVVTTDGHVPQAALSGSQLKPPALPGDTYSIRTSSICLTASSPRPSLTASRMAPIHSNKTSTLSTGPTSLLRSASLNT